MAIVVLKLPDVKRKRADRPKRCPYCAGETFQRWGQVIKAVKDGCMRTVRVYRRSKLKRMSRFLSRKQTTYDRPQTTVHGQSSVIRVGCPAHNCGG